MLLISSELEEIIEGSDRVVTLRDGRSVAELTGDQITEDALMQAIATGAAADSAVCDRRSSHDPGSRRPTGRRAGHRTATRSPRRDDRRPAPRWRWKGWAQRYGALAALVALFVYNAVDTPFFLTRSRCCSSCCGRRRRSRSSRSAWRS